MPGAFQPASGLAGLTLQAWALISGTTLIRGFNVSSIARPAVGQWQLNLGTAAAAVVVIDSRLQNFAGNGGPLSVSNTSGGGTTTVTYRTENNAATLTDPAVQWIAVYG